MNDEHNGSNEMTTTPAYALAEEIAGQMSDDDRATYTRAAWTDGVEGMAARSTEYDGIEYDADETLDHLDAMIAKIRG